MKKCFELFLFLFQLVWCATYNHVIGTDWQVEGERHIVTEIPQNYKNFIRVKVLHFLLPIWGNSKSDDFSCERHVKCEWIVSDSIPYFHSNSITDSNHHHHHHPVVTVGLYNIHSLWEKFRVLKPQVCKLPTNITMYETEESHVRYGWYYDNSQPHFDAYSSTHPNSDVQRVYQAAFLNQTDFLPLKNFSSLIKGGSYVASDCHRNDGANSHRDEVVLQLRSLGLRVDGLGNCLRTHHIPEGVGLRHIQYNPNYNIILKRQVLRHYAFHMAFENSFEEGYVTEKVFDSLVSGKISCLFTVECLANEASSTRIGPSLSGR